MGHLRRSSEGRWRFPSGSEGRDRVRDGQEGAAQKVKQVSEHVGVTPGRSGRPLSPRPYVLCRSRDRVVSSVTPALSGTGRTSRPSPLAVDWRPADHSTGPVSNGSSPDSPRRQHEVYFPTHVSPILLSPSPWDLGRFSPPGRCHPRRRGVSLVTHPLQGVDASLRVRGSTVTHTSRYVSPATYV